MRSENKTASFSLAKAWKQAKKLLCVRLDTFGDVLMTTPAIRALRESAGGRRITLLTSGVGQHIARMVPEIDQIIVYDAPWMKATEPRSDAGPDLWMIERLRAERFDAAVIFTVYSQNPLPSAVLCQLSDIPLRLAYCRENPYQLLSNWIVEREPQEFFRHEVQRQLDLVAAVGASTANRRMSLSVPDHAPGRTLAVLAAQGVDLRRPWLVIHPGASAPSRRYPPALFSEAADALVTRLGFQVIFTGTRSEAELVETVRTGMQADSISVAGLLNLGELAALLRMAPLLIANNTGPVHMAAALGTPVVDIYALTNPQHTPWEVESRILFHDVPCKNCYKSVCPEGHNHCLTLVNPNAVAQAAAELLAERKLGEAASWR